MKFRVPLASIAQILCLSVVSHTSFARLQTPEEAPLAARFSMFCRIAPDNSQDCTTTERFTILRPAGRELISRRDFTYEESDRFTLRDAAVIQPDGKRIPLAKTQIDTRTAPNPDDGLRRTRQTSLTFPGLKPGSSVVSTVALHTAGDALDTPASGVFSFDSKPVRYDSIRVEFVADRPLFWRSEAAEGFTIVSSDQGKRLVIELKKPRYFNVVDEEDTALRKVPRIEFGSSERAQDYFGPFAKLYNAIAGAPLPRQAAAMIKTLRGKPESERVAASMNYISTHFRYLADWRLATRGSVPFSLAQVEANGYGDCKDLAVLLVAILRASGIAAEPALVYRGLSAPSLLMPGTSAINHVIVHATVGGKSWWLDPTDPLYLQGRTPSDLQDRWVFVLEKSGQVRQDRIDAEAPATSIDFTRQERFKKDGSAETEGSAYLDGIRLVGLMALDREQGASAGDRQLCNGWVYTVGRCDIERPATDKSWPGRYRIKASVREPKALEKVSGEYVYDGAKSAGEWGRYAQYRQGGEVGDIYLGDGEIIQGIVRLENVKARQALQACTVRSPWYDIDVMPEKSPAAGVAYRYRRTQKVRWLTHDDLVSAAFGRFLDEAGRCDDAMRLKVSF